MSALDKVLEDIRRERGRQQLLLRQGKIHFDCASPATSKALQITVLAEEFGEAVIELSRIHDGRLRYGAARTELIQLAAVAAAIAESLEAA